MIRLWLAYTWFLFFVVGSSILFKKEALEVLEYQALRPVLFNAFNWILNTKLQIPIEQRRVFPGFETHEYACRAEVKNVAYFPGDEIDLSASGNVDCPRFLKFSGSGKLKLFKKVKGDFAFQHSEGVLQVNFGKTSFFLSSELGFLHVVSKAEANTLRLTSNQNGSEFFCKRGFLELENLNAKLPVSLSYGSVLANHGCLITYREKHFNEFWKDFTAAKTVFAGDFLDLYDINHFPREEWKRIEMKADWTNNALNSQNPITRELIQLKVEKNKGTEGKQAQIQWEITNSGTKKCRVYEIKKTETGEKPVEFLSFDTNEMKGLFLINYETHKENEVFLQCENDSSFAQSAPTRL